VLQEKTTGLTIVQIRHGFDLNLRLYAGFNVSNGPKDIMGIFSFWQSG